MEYSFLFGTTRRSSQWPARRLRDLRPSLPGRSAVAAVLHSVVHQGPTVNQQTTESSFHRRWRLCETPGIYSWHRERCIVFKCWICDWASSSHAALTCPLGDRLLVDTTVQIGKILHDPLKDVFSLSRLSSSTLYVRCLQVRENHFVSRFHSFFIEPTQNIWPKRRQVNRILLKSCDSLLTFDKEQRL